MSGLKKKSITLTLDEAKIDWLKKHLKNRGRSISSYINELVHDISASVICGDESRK